MQNKTLKDTELIAIVGMGVNVPGADNLELFWNNILLNKTFFEKANISDWGADPSLFYLENPAYDKTYSLYSAFNRNCRLNIKDLNLPKDFDPHTADASLLYWLSAGLQASQNVNYKNIDPKDVGVISGHVILPTTAMAEATVSIYGKEASKKWNLKTEIFPPAPKKAFTALGFSANLLKDVLGFTGTSYTIDAACASSLYAVNLASEELLSGNLKAVITGGVAKADALFTQLGFSQLKALSKKGEATPFDNTADGLVVGEGAAALVLKRLDQAIKDKDTIYALIRGVGLSNDTSGSLLAPQVEGQIRSMKSAWGKAQLDDYSNLGLIEAHGTSTILGDNTEVQSLKTFFSNLKNNNKEKAPVLSSIKGNIGHLLSAAGAVSLIKTVLALNKKILPPTAGFKNEANGLNLHDSPALRVLKEQEIWEKPKNNLTRLAAVNAFGFGGVNAQIVLEEWQETNYTKSNNNVEIKTEKNENIHILSARALLAPWPNYYSLCQHWLNPEDPPLISNRKFGSVKASGLFFENFQLDSSLFKLTPKELANILPQQALILKVNQEALADIKLEQYKDKIDPNRIGIFMGVDIDPRSSAYAFRWLAPIRAAIKLEQMGVIKDREINKFIQILREETKIPPLNASKVIGSLGSIVASRVARHLNSGGPSFTVCQVNRCGLKALDIAMDFINRKEIDLAIVSSVDTIGDPKTSFFEPDKLWEEGAATLILASEKLAKKLNKENSLTIEKLNEATTRLGSLGGLLSLVKNSFYLEHRLHAKRFSSNFSYHLNAENFPKRKLKSVGYEISDNSKTRPIHPIAKAYLNENWFLIKANHKNSLDEQIKMIKEMLLEEEKNNTKAEFLGSEKAEKISLTKITYNFYLNNLTNKEKPFVAIPVKNFYELKEKIKLIDFKNKFYISKTKILTPKVSNLSGKLAFLYPGSGAHYHYLTKQLCLDFPHLTAEIENTFKHGSAFFQNQLFWESSYNNKNITESEALISQVNFALLANKILAEYNIKANAAIGYSLGETSSLIANNAWQNLDALYEDLQKTTLFKTDLAGPLNAAHKYWNIPTDKKIKWLTGVIPKTKNTIIEAIKKLEQQYLNKVFVLINNSQTEVLIGGEEEAVKALTSNLKCPFFPLNNVSIAHNPIVKIVEDEYKKFHTREINKNIDIEIYSPALLKKHILDSESVANAITKQAIEGHDFQKLIENAYEDGIKYFLEIGPGNSLTRLVRNILKGKEFFSEALFKNNHNENLESLHKSLVKLWLAGYNLDISQIFLKSINDEAKIPVNINFNPPQNTWDSIEELSKHNFKEEIINKEIKKTIVKKENDKIDYLSWLKKHTTIKPNINEEINIKIEKKILLNREQCLEFAIGKIAPVLGKQFTPVDLFPSRVRLPNEPLMFVDRILTIEGQALSLSSGRLVSEHDILENAWYLDNNHIPTGFAIESGQADLLLSAWLGADFATRGKAYYRLLDAQVTFYRDLPKVGETVQYDIKIVRFFKHANTHLFRFEFTASIDGEPLLKMVNGCAGFFTKEELKNGRGLAKSTIADAKENNIITNSENVIFYKHNFNSFSEEQIKNLREKNLNKAFGKNYIELKNPLTIPDNEMALIDKVLKIDLAGGNYKNGFIKTETKIDPKAWFLTSHFMDDEVMPGTLMYETCLYSLRIYLLSIGWIGESDTVDWQPLLNSEATLKCRGQVTPETKVASYELHIKKLDFNPEPYAIADAIMIADNKEIVEVKNMNLRLKNSSFEKLTEIWQTKEKESNKKFNKKMLLAHAGNKISDCLGERYKKFDATNSFVARLPRPPYDLIDSAETDAEEKVLKDNILTATFNLKKDSWLIKDSGGNNPKLNYAALNEIALQPCGFLASYMGSALNAPTSMHFRNLGGEAKIFNNLSVDSEIKTTVQLTKSSQIGDIIIQHYNFNCKSNNKIIYKGKTHFGFFSPESLAKQEGLKENTESLLCKEHKFKNFTNYPQGTSWATNNWKMLDKIALEENGGPKRLGWGIANKTVNPKDWFFKAHFYQDPVWPGSLGLESFLQLGKALIAPKIANKNNLNKIVIDWDTDTNSHNWLYRGQVTPKNKEVKIAAYISKIEDGNIFYLNGFLWADNLLIYQMNDFSIKVLNNSNESILFGRELKSFRIKNKLTQKELAEKTSIHASTISSLEKGIRKATNEQLRQILKIFGKDFNKN